MHVCYLRMNEKRNHVGPRIPTGIGYHEHRDRGFQHEQNTTSVATLLQDKKEKEFFFADNTRKRRETHKRWEFFGEIIDGQDQDCMGIGMAAIVGS